MLRGEPQFERGTIDETLVADRLIQLRDKTKQLRARHDELTLTLDDHRTAPSPITLTDITNIINTGNTNQRKALVEALVAHVTITAPDRLIPVFRIPQPHTPNGAATALPAETTPQGAVRTMTKSVDQLRLEPPHGGGHYARVNAVPQDASASYEVEGERVVESAFLRLTLNLIAHHCRGTHIVDGAVNGPHRLQGSQLNHGQLSLPSDRIAAVLRQRSV